MVSFLHAADLHIGKSRSFPNYLDRQSTMVDAIFDTAKEKTDGLVILAGDIFDCEALRPREKDLFIDRLAQADEEGITTFVLNGNHDIIDQNDSGYTHLRVVKNLVDKKRLQNTICIEFEPTEIYLEKYKTAIIAVPALYRKTKEVNAIVSSLTKRIHKNHGVKTPIIAVVHEAVLGSVNDVGFSFASGVKLDPDIPVTYWALGDIHKMQQISGVPNAFYSGCPIQHDFSDSIQRGVLVVNTDKPEEPDFVPLYHKVSRLVTITANETQDLNKLDIPKDAIVRLEASKQQIAEAYLPDNVVKTKITNSPERSRISKPVGLDDVYDGLVDLLSEAGMDDAGQKFCLDFVQKL